jgi:hypothetical protein
MLDSLGKRYGMLPSKILENASTLDIFVMDAALSYKDFIERKDKGDFTQTYTTDDLATIMSNARKKHG